MRYLIALAPNTNREIMLIILNCPSPLELLPKQGGDYQMLTSHSLSWKGQLSKATEQIWAQKSSEHVPSPCKTSGETRVPSSLKDHSAASGISLLGNAFLLFSFLFLHLYFHLTPAFSTWYNTLTRSCFSTAFVSFSHLNQYFTLQYPSWSCTSLTCLFSPH